MIKLEIAGYVIIDSTAIWGIGATLEAAWDDLAQSMEAAGIPHASTIDPDDVFATKGWMETDFQVVPATADLISDVQARGGAISWDVYFGAACATYELEAIVQ